MLTARAWETEGADNGTDECDAEYLSCVVSAV
jgi:hypothetical protein